MHLQCSKRIIVLSLDCFFPLSKPIYLFIIILSEVWVWSRIKHFSCFRTAKAGTGLEQNVSKTKLTTRLLVVSHFCPYYEHFLFSGCTLNSIYTIVANNQAISPHFHIYFHIQCHPKPPLPPKKPNINTFHVELITVVLQYWKTCCIAS